MTFYKHSFSLAVLSVLVSLLASSVSARPTTRQQSGPRAVPTPISRKDDTQTIETVQVITMFGENTTETCTLIRTSTTTANGEDAIVFSENCSFLFTPTTSAAPTSAPVTPTSSTSGSVTTIISSPASGSTGKVLFSMFTTDALPMSTTTAVISATNASSSTTTTTITTTTTPISQTTTKSATAVNDTASSTAPLESSLLPLPAPASSTSSDPFTATAQSHLSSLPIFLGAFGGIAGLALLVVGIKVYRPIQRFNEMRLRPSNVARHLRQGTGSGWGLKRWRRSGERDSEKLTARNSQDAESGSEQSHGPPSAWMS